jgi:outer membrane immunogenic protein
MKRILFASIAIIGLAATAQAEMLSPTVDWTGPYIGAQGGYGAGDSTGGLRVGGFAIPYDVHPDGVVGGAHLGYDWQSGHLVLGGVADAEGADIFGTDTTTTAQFSTKVLNDFDASIRGKIGLAFNRFMFYGTGGVAFGAVKTQYSCPTCLHAPDPYDQINDIRVGWTAGGGIAYAIDPRWSSAVEYRYVDLGNGRFSDPVTTASDSGNHLAFNSVRLSVSYHFWPHRQPTPEPPPIVPAMAPVPVPPAPPPPHAFVVFFDFDRYDLTPEARLVVEQAAKSFRDSGFARIELNGYTDLAGTQEYNMKLSQRRATTVAEYLAHLGVPRPAMSVMWHGKENPRVPTADGVRAPQNRRVEIVMP